MKKRLVTLLLAMAMVLSLCACGGNNNTNNDLSTPDGGNAGIDDSSQAELYASDGQVMTVGGEVVFGMTFDADFFSPFYQGHAVNYVWPVMEPLAYYHSVDQSWSPCLATDWERDSDTSLLIYLTDKATWSDGTPFTAADVIATWDARFEHGTDSVIGSPTNYEAVDEHTVRIEWAQPSLQFEVWALCQHIYQAQAIADHDTDWLNTNLLGTGPYTLVSFVPDQELIFEKREDYWGEPVALDKITTRYIKDPVAQLAAFINGEIDSMTVRDGTTATQLEQEGHEGIINDSMGTNYYALIIAKDPDAPLTNEAVRRAIYMHGVDWDAYAMIVGGSLGFHTDMLGIPGMSYYRDTLEQTEYDPELCKQELAEAGYPDGFSCNIYASSSTTTMATVLQESLKQLEITAEIVMLDDSLSFGKILASDEYMSGILFGNFTHNVYPQMDRFIKHLGPDATFGAAGECSPERRAAWDKAFAASTTEEEDQYLYEYVDAYVHKEAAIWPTHNTSILNFYQSWYHQSAYANTIASGVDPHEIWASPK